VAFEGESIERFAQEAGPQFEQLAADLNNEFTTWLLTQAEDGEPFGPELVAAIQDFEGYCAEKGAPVSA
jgi:hypothetical protein